MTTAIGFGNNTEKLLAIGCDIATDSFLKLIDNIGADTVIVAENPGAEILKGLDEAYGITVLDANNVHGGLSAEDEKQVELMKYAGNSYMEIAEKTGRHPFWIVNSRAFSGKTHIEKLATGILS